VAKYDPVKGYIADGIPDHPVGSVEELKSRNLPLKFFQSCSEPDINGTSAGCPFWHDCNMSYKGLPVVEGGGPRNHCWERMKAPENGGGIVRNVQPCYWGVAQQDIAHENKEVLRIIANEGETFDTLTEVPDPSGGADQNGYKKWVKKMLTLEVPSFKRIGQEEKLAKHELRSEIMKREQEKRREQQQAALLGVQTNDIPTDKQFRGGSKGAKKEG
jgi:hypothetical protein